MKSIKSVYKIGKGPSSSHTVGPYRAAQVFSAMRALSSVNLSRFLYATRKISFDDVVTTMYRTGLDMDEKYRETSHGGLAQIYKNAQTDGQ